VERRPEPHNHGLPEPPKRVHNTSTNLAGEAWISKQRQQSTATQAARSRRFRRRYASRHRLFRTITLHDHGSSRHSHHRLHSRRFSTITTIPSETRPEIESFYNHRSPEKLSTVPRPRPITITTISSETRPEIESFYNQITG
jgi:hypothetical protein